MLDKLSDDTKVSAVAAVCLMGLAVVFKNVLQLEDVPFVVLFSPLWIYIAYLSTRDNNQDKFDSPLYWNAILILVTMAVIVLYAFF